MSAELREQVQSSLGTAYTIERELGGGGMSRTYVAMEQALSRRVVVKVLSPELAAGVSVERFRREIMLAAKLQHPHIVPVLSSGDADGLPWFTMPFVEGESLRATPGARPARRSVRSPGSCATWRARWTFAHEHGVVHRDIKPDNVLLSGGSATVTDFGVAKAISAARTGPARRDAHAGRHVDRLTGVHGAEQAAGDPNIDHRADIYALRLHGVRAARGQAAVHRSSPAKLLGAHLGEAPRDIRELRPDVPPALADLVMRSLAKDPDHQAPGRRATWFVSWTRSPRAATSTAAPAILAPRIRAGRAAGVVGRVRRHWSD